MKMFEKYRIVNINYWNQSLPIRKEREEKYKNIGYKKSICKTKHLIMIKSFYKNKNKMQCLLI